MKIYHDDIGEVCLEKYMGNDLDVVNMARQSFGNEKLVMEAGDRKLLKRLVDHDHWSPFEHCFVRFWCVVPIYIARQHMRHRSWSFSELSRRYTSNNLQFYEPVDLRKQSTSNRQASLEDDLVEKMEDGPKDWIKDADRYSLYTYERLLSQGVCREQARGVLPASLYTSYHASCSLRSLIHFLSLRVDHGAQWEIQKLAEGMQELVSDIFPLSMQYYKEKTS